MSACSRQVLRNREFGVADIERGLLSVIESLAAAGLRRGRALALLLRITALGLVDSISVGEGLRLTLRGGRLIRLLLVRRASNGLLRLGLLLLLLRMNWNVRLLLVIRVGRRRAHSLTNIVGLSCLVVRRGNLLLRHRSL